ncbi:MAG: hypothetical protein AB7K24_14245 [Gemmataceae bacterium]
MTEGEHKEEEKKDEPQAEKKDEAEASAEKKDEAEASAEKKDEPEKKDEGHDDHDDHGHGHAAAVGSPFSETQLEEMHASDRVAARNIVLLLFAIFMMGVGIYAYVAYTVASGWWAT